MFTHYCLYGTLCDVSALESFIQNIEINLLTSPFIEYKKEAYTFLINHNVLIISKVYMCLVRLRKLSENTEINESRPDSLVKVICF